MQALSELFTLPSGIKATIREMTGVEEDLFANERLVKSGKIANALLGNVILDIDGEKPSSAQISEMWSADRTAALLHTRILSLGESVEGEVECTNDECGLPFKVVVDNLLEDLEYRPCPEEMELRVELPGNKSAVLRPGKGVDEEKLLKARQKGELITELLFTRTVSIDGIESRQELRDFLRNGSLRVRRALQSKLNEVEFGFQTQIEVDCYHCGEKHEVDVQGLRGFFSPETE